MLYSCSYIWICLQATCGSVTDLLLGGQRRGLHSVDQQVAQQFGDKLPLQVDVDEP